MTEDRESAIYATGYWKGVEYKRMRELTDKEIDNLIMDVVEKPTNEDLYDFARAILKKASERA
jgi:hypothetical protein